MSENGEREERKIKDCRDCGDSHISDSSCFVQGIKPQA